MKYAAPICGWSNYSGKVTSYIDSRKTIGNRGSKSIVEFIPLIVKEQRVDGSW